MGGDCSGGVGAEVTYFHREPPARAAVEKEELKPSKDIPNSGVLSQSSLDPNLNGRGRTLGGGLCLEKGFHISLD